MVRCKARCKARR